MTMEAVLQMYDRQATLMAAAESASDAVTEAVERMGAALAAAADRMEELLTKTQTTAVAAGKLKSPMDAMVKNISSSVEKEGVAALSGLSPEKQVLSLAINVGWQLFGDDIMTILSPAMTVLEAFAGAVHSLVTALGPVFAPVVWLAEQLAAGLDLMGAHAAGAVPLLVGLGAALLVLKGQAIAMATAAGIQAAVTLAMAAAQAVATWVTNGLNLAILACPLLWLAILVGAVVAVIYQWVQSVGGLQMAWLICCNVVQSAWDQLYLALMTGVYYVMNRWEQLQLAFFTASVYIQDVMGDMRVGVLTILQNMVNGAIGIINGLITRLNQLPGVSIGLMEQVTFGATAQMENEAAKQARQQALADHRSEVAAGAAQRGTELEALRTSAAQAAQQRQLEIEAAQHKAAIAQSEKVKGAGESETDWTAWGEDTRSVGETSLGNGLMGGEKGLDRVGQVESVGEVRGDVNIAEEDLRFMKDVAEMRYVQNFVTLTPTVAMNASISERVDVGTVVSEIERRLEEEFAANAEGVYA